MINRVWMDAVSEANLLTQQPTEAGRIVNLSVAAGAAMRRGLLAGGKRSRLDGRGLSEIVRELALSALPIMSHEIIHWDRLARFTGEIVRRLNEPTAVDEWVGAWQAFGSGRKTRGAYATPSVFATSLAHATLGPFLRNNSRPRVVDPSAGAGALLIAAYRILSSGSTAGRRCRTLMDLHGVESDPLSRELCCLILWLVAGTSKEDLLKIGENVVVADAITRDWWDANPAFDVLLMNPPWESLRHALTARDPESAARNAMIARLRERESGAVGLPPLYSAQGRGDRNLFKAFMELAPHLLKEDGRLGALVPGAFASDLGMAPLRQRYFSQLAIESWTGFENLRRHFQIDSRYKFGLLIAARSRLGTSTFRMRSFAIDPEEVHAEHAVVALHELPRLGGPSLMLPELKDGQEKEILVQALSEGTPLFERGSLGTVRYKRELDLTNGLRKKAFTRFESHRRIVPVGEGFFSRGRGELLVPLVEGRMVGQYDMFQKSWVDGRGRTARWEITGAKSLDDCRPQFITKPRAGSELNVSRIAICDVTSATNSRTVHASWVPDGWRCGNTAPVLEFDSALYALAGLGILNSMVFDWVARRIVGGLHLNKFYLATLVWPVLSNNDMLRAAEAAAFLCSQNPRFYAAGGRHFLEKAGIESLDYASPSDAHATIETIVALNFGLDIRMITRVFSPSREDRRGFWRHFASTPTARDIASRVVVAA